METPISVIRYLPRNNTYPITFFRYEVRHEFRVNLDRPQPYLAEPIELLLTTETETPDDNIIKNFDGEFSVVIPVYVEDVDFQVRVRAHKSSRDGSDVAETGWVTYKTFDGVGYDIAFFGRNCEYRCTTSAVGSRVFIADSQWAGVS